MRWELISSEIMYRCAMFTVRRNHSRSAHSQQTHDFHVLETRDWVNVVPITDDQRVVMVQQFRHGIRDLTLEVPAGILDDTDRDPAAGALRELREETGYVAARVALLGTVHPNPAIMTNRCHIFAAYDVRKVGAPQWDATEELVVQTVPLTRIPEFVRLGMVSNALTLAAFHLLSWSSTHEADA